MLDTFGDGHGGFIRCVELAPVFKLFDAWNNELANRVIRVIPVD